MKDNFSSQSKLYAKFRPHYPAALYDHVYSKVKSFQTAWDCGTGNGQVASVLSDKFDQVIASDISKNQLAQAQQKSNIEYIVSPAEHTSIEGSSVDLITVAQALHWFDVPAFIKETQRVASKDAVLAYWGYGLLSISAEVDPIIKEFHDDAMNGYWDPERYILTNEYKAIDLDLADLELKYFKHEVKWSLADLEGYLNTWSSVRKYIERNNTNLVNDIIDKLRDKWQGGTITFPLFVYTGTIKN
ncbi:class I SAM-dependent methyltransferase [Fulvivirga ligni]|uniref:class I SAM-dependent methyltransferase n=1 Tax=Fulvivirga ligni TaxID=2904246 RepID=UPI001F37F7C3|nr:class I SAM-dependent methyltransferase [Fulvivirga ligni]UII20115.1 class I SAM-dependent methyltransferase [Fulvivirga ligni]